MTAVFSVTDFVLIRPLPFPRADRLVILWERHPGYGRMELSPANYRDWKHSATAFSRMAAFTFTSANLTGAGEPRRLQGTEVAADFLPTLGVQPLIGRGFTASDDTPGAPGTIILTYRLWQTEFGGSPDIIGRKVVLDEVPHAVIGVMPNTFHYPSEDTEFWTPIQMTPQWFVDRNDNFLDAIARLGDGVTVEQARAEGDLIAGQLTRQYAKDNAHTGLRVNTWREEMPQQTRLLLTALGAAALCVLLIVCANLASLLLTRALSRRQELAIRTAMGAGRERLVRQLMTESVVLAAAGGGVGVLVGAAAVPLLMRLVPASLPLAAAPHVDLRVLAFAGVLTLLTGVLFGTLPVVRASRDDLGGLRDTARAGGGRKERLRAGLVVAEIVASVVLLVSAGLLLRALWRVQSIHPGFQVEHVVTMRTALPMPQYESTARRRVFYTSVLDGVRALPGVSSAAYISFAPMTFGGGIFPVSTNGQARLDRSDGYNASLRYVTPGFFKTLDIPVVQGRDVAESDTADRQPVAVVSESFAKQFLADGANPIGRRFQFAFRDLTVVGVVGDIHVRGLERESEPQVYLPYLQQADGALVFYAPKDLIVRSSVALEALLPSIRAIVHKADPEQPLSNVRSMAQTIENETASRAAQLRVLGAFAANRAPARRDRHPRRPVVRRVAAHAGDRRADGARRPAARHSRVGSRPGRGARRRRRRSRHRPRLRGRAPARGAAGGRHARRRGHLRGGRGARDRHDARRQPRAGPARGPGRSDPRDSSGLTPTGQSPLSARSVSIRASSSVTSFRVTGTIRSDSPASRTPVRKCVVPYTAKRSFGVCVRREAPHSVSTIAKCRPLALRMSSTDGVSSSAVTL